MLHRSFAGLLIAAVSALPVLAQDTATPPTTPAAATEELSAATQPGTDTTEAAPPPAVPAAATEASAPPQPAPVAAEATSAPAVPPSQPPAASTEPATASALASGDTAAGPVPIEATPDPLTPPTVDLGPAVAPGASPRKAPPPSVAAVPHPLVASVTARLALWPEPRAAADRADLQALKTFYGEADTTPLWVGDNGLSERGRSAIAALRRADQHGLDAAAFEVPSEPSASATPEALAEAEIRLGLAALKYARHARGGRIDPPALSQIIDMRPRPYEPSTLLDAFAAASSVETYLESLHPSHAGFVALRSALADARSAPDNANQVRRIVANMERWRWLPDDLGAFYVWDNVPEQTTRVYRGGKAVLKERIVVGKTHTPTPVFSAPMKFVIFHPSWGVPEGIKTNELGPMLRRAQSNSSVGWLFGDSGAVSRALARHELRVYRGGREINPESVNWSAVDIRQFSFTQPPSGRNVLGIVKFRFPNRFDVYMHDTTEKHLFSRSSRLYSHGCMRVENPLRLAETILAYDKGWGRERIQALVARGGTTDVTLDKEVPVHVVYFTASVDENGRLASFPDVYGLDHRVASALAGKPVPVASEKAAPTEEVRRTARSQETAARKTVQREKKRKPPQNQDFNPFAFLSAN